VPEDDAEEAQHIEALRDREERHRRPDRARGEVRLGDPQEERREGDGKGMGRQRRRLTKQRRAELARTERKNRTAAR
jgi:hypothetical protein